MDSAQHKDRVSKPMNSWMLFWQEFVKSVRLEGEGMTDAGARASMLWAVMTAEERAEWEARAAEDRKAHAATLHGWVEFVPPMAQKNKSTRNVHYPEDSPTSPETSGSSHSAFDSPELPLVKSTCSSSTMLPRWDSLAFPTWDSLEAGYQSLSSFSPLPSNSSLRVCQALNDRTTLTTDMSRGKLYSPIYELLNENTYGSDSSTPTYVEETVPGLSDFSASPELFDLEPNNPEGEFDRALRRFIEQAPALPHDSPPVISYAPFSAVILDPETIWDRSATTSDFTATDTTLDIFDWESFLSDSYPQT